MTLGTPGTYARRTLPAIHIRSASSASLPPPRPSPAADSNEGVESAVAAVIGDSLVLEPLDTAVERGITPGEWLGREQVKYWTLQEKTAKRLRALHRDYAFDTLVSDSKQLHRIRREALEHLDLARRCGDKHKTKEESDKVAEIDAQLVLNLEQRDGWTGWKVYVELSHRIEERVREMKRMWEAHERVPFDNAWKGHFGNR